MLAELRIQGIEVHARSIFLQGLLLQDPKSLPRKFISMADWLVGVRKISNELNISVHELAILFVVTNPLVDHAVVGVNSAAQLVEIIRAISSGRLDINLSQIAGLTDAQIIDPRKWKP
jgi:aryl-alcohol dehydrogenase-like predicted oxidoreductase